MAVRKLPDGRWRVDWRDPSQGGRIVSEYFGRGEDGRSAALEREHEIKIQKIKNRGLIQAYGPSFRELAQEYINARSIELSSKTRSEILRTLAVYALPIIGSLPINKITIANWTSIEKVLLRREVKAQTINKYFQYISRIFMWAVERGYLKDNPWRNRRTLRAHRPKIELITTEELARIMEAADDHLRWAIEVELNVGCRPGPSELFALKWDDFNYQTGAVRIYASKTDSYHTQYVSKDFLERLKARREFCRQENLRLARRRGQIEPECPYVISFHGEKVFRLNSAWESAKKKAGITRPIRFYDLRHYYITHALAGGADILDLAHRVGHKDATMIVTVYAHLVEALQSKKPLFVPPPDLQKARTNGAEFAPNGGHNTFFMPKLLVKNVGQIGDTPN